MRFHSTHKIYENNCRRYDGLRFRHQSYSTRIINFFKKHPDIQVIAVGRKEELKELEGKCEIIDTPDVVPMDVSAMDVMRMRSSSLMVAIQTMKDRGLDAVVSAGSTGGFLTAATIKLKLIEGVQRAALVSPFPTKIKGKKVTIWTSVRIMKTMLNNLCNLLF